MHNTNTTWAKKYKQKTKQEKQSSFIKTVWMSIVWQYVYVCVCAFNVYLIGLGFPVLVCTQFYELGQLLEGCRDFWHCTLPSHRLNWLFYPDFQTAAYLVKSDISIIIMHIFFARIMMSFPLSSHLVNSLSSLFFSSWSPSVSFSIFAFSSAGKALIND